MGMTSSPSNPKPGTLVNVAGHKRYAEYVYVSRYRLKKLYNGWNLYIADADGWGKPTWCRSKKAAEAYIAEHMGSGKVVSPKLNIAARMARLEKRVEELEKRYPPPGTPDDV